MEFLPPMARERKFTEQQKYEIALELIGGKLSQSEICRKHGISSTYAYKLRDRALESIREGINRTNPKQPQREVELEKRVEKLEQLAGDQALLIRELKKTVR